MLVGVELKVCTSLIYFGQKGLKGAEKLFWEGLKVDEGPCIALHDLEAVEGCLHNVPPSKGASGFPNLDVFLENFRRGGGHF